MTEKKVLSVIAKYERKFKKLNVQKKSFPHGEYPRNWRDKLSHCYSMLDEMKEFVSQNRMGKVFRWLGFI